jgi:hypothetical protein
MHEARITSGLAGMKPALGIEIPDIGPSSFGRSMNEMLPIRMPRAKRHIRSRKDSRKG